MLWEEVLIDFLLSKKLLSTHCPVLILYHYILGVYPILRPLYHRIPWLFRQAYGLLVALQCLFLRLSPHTHLFLHLLNPFSTEKLNAVTLMLCVQEVQNEPLEHNLSRFTDDLILRGLVADHLTLNGYIILW
jgi:hypothetical protein